MKIDAIIVTRERQKKLLTAVNSVLNNELLPQRIIIIQADDGKNHQKNKAIIEKKCNERKVDLYYKTVKNKGIAYSNNIALKLIKSPYFCFLDDDEIAPKNWLKTASKIWQEQAECVAITGPKIPKDHLTNFSHHVFYELIIADSMKRHAEVDFVPTGNGFFKTQFFKKNKLKFDEDFARASADMVISLKIKKLGGKMFFDYRLRVQHDTSKSLSKLLKQWFAYGQMDLLFYNKYLESNSRKLGRFKRNMLHLGDFLWAKKVKKNSWQKIAGFYLINGSYTFGRIWGALKYYQL